MSQGFTQPPGGTFGSSSGGFSGGQSGFGGGSQGGGFGGPSTSSSGATSGGFGGGSSGGFNGSSSSGLFDSPTTGSSGGSQRRGRLQSAPVEWIMSGLIVGLISLGLNVWLTVGSLVATDGAFAIVAAVAWALAGVVGVLLIGKHMAVVIERKSSGFYTEISWKRGLFYITAVVLLGAVVWSAVDFAQWAGKRSW